MFSRLDNPPGNPQGNLLVLRHVNQLIFPLRNRQHNQQDNQQDNLQRCLVISHRVNRPEDQHLNHQWDLQQVHHFNLPRNLPALLHLNHQGSHQDIHLNNQQRILQGYLQDSPHPSQVDNLHAILRLNQVQIPLCSHRHSPQFIRRVNRRQAQVHNLLVNQPVNQPYSLQQIQRGSHLVSQLVNLHRNRPVNHRRGPLHNLHPLLQVNLHINLRLNLLYSPQGNQQVNHLRDHLHSHLDNHLHSHHDIHPSSQLHNLVELLRINQQCSLPCSRQ